jgi:hypothetical protein
MRKLLILAAVVAVSAACHNRSEDETGAAPERGDATVTATDTASVPTDSTMGQRPGATDTSAVRQADTTSMGAMHDSTDMGAMHDSTGMGAMHDSTGMGAMHDTTKLDEPADSTARQ